MMPVRTGVIGFGLAGRVFHTPFVQAVPPLQLFGIVQRTGDDAARAYPAATIFRSVEDLLHSDVDLVVIATPNATHLPFAKAALEAGKHVVIDKPFAPTLQAALELEALAQQKGLLLAPFHNRRFDGDFLTLQHLLATNDVGRPITLRSHFDRFRPTQKPNSWKESDGPMNGLLMDLGTHLVDQALALFGRPDTVSGTVRSDRDISDIDDAFDITLTFPCESRTVRVELGATMLAAAPQPRFLLQGTRGSYQKFGVDPQEPAILAGAKVPSLASDTDWLTEQEQAWGTLTTAPDPVTSSSLVRRTLPTHKGDYRAFYRAVAASIQDGTPLPVTARDAVRVAHLIELVRESSTSGRTLTPSPELW